MIHRLAPGPQLFEAEPGLVYGIFVSLFVADFIGETNKIDTKVAAGKAKIGKAAITFKAEDAPKSGEVIAVIRPEDVIPHSAGPKRAKARGSRGANLIDVKIDSMEFLGSYWRAHLGGTSLAGVPMVANFSMNAVRRLGLEEGIDMTVELPAERVLVFAKAG